MAYTARKEVECKEFFDAPDVLAAKIKYLAKLVKRSKHFVAFTGAGISTAAGIADYRSGINTALDTGAGKWAKDAARKAGRADEIKAPKRKKISSFKAVPTAAHMSLVALMTTGPKYLKYLISQNTDGLHRRSGIPVDQMSELHGNGTIEFCKKCGKEFMRDYKCRKSLRKQMGKDHFTGRYCTVARCGGKLHDTIVNFGENLPQTPLAKAEANSEPCDLMLSLGSSLTVTPAADMPQLVGEEWQNETSGKDEHEDGDDGATHHLVIVNLQATPLDHLCSKKTRIFAKIDDVMIGLMKELELEIPQWNLNRFLKVKLEHIAHRDDLRKCTISGVDIDGINASVFTGVKLRNNGQKLQHTNIHSKYDKIAKFLPDEYVFHIPSTLQIDDIDHDEEKEPPNEENENENDDNKNEEVQVEVDKKKGLVVELSFYEHYQEPKLLIALNDYLKFLEKQDGEVVMRLVFDLKAQQWRVGSVEQQMTDADIGKLWKVFDATQNDDD